MKINDRQALMSEAVSRVLNNVPVSELLRVYSLALQTELEQMDDDELLSSLATAGYLDLIEKHASEGNGEGTYES